MKEMPGFPLLYHRPGPNFEPRSSQMAQSFMFFSLAPLVICLANQAGVAFSPALPDTADRGKCAPGASVALLAVDEQKRPANPRVFS